MTPVFSFGSNLDLRQMLARCPGARVIGPALLRGWRLAFAGPSVSRAGGVATIVRARGQSVPGLLYELTDADLDRLDRFEGSPHFYAPAAVRVRRGRQGTGRRVFALTYILDRPIAAPSLAYLRIILQAYAALRLPPGPVARALREAEGMEPGPLAGEPVTP